jgi:hypothetical protein
MPIQIDEVQVEMVAQPKSQAATSNSSEKSGPDLRRVFERMQQRSARLIAD